MDEGLLGKDYIEGELICRQGEAGDQLYVIQAGRVKIFREEGGLEIPVGDLRTGDVFGEMAIFDRQPRSATVRAAGRARILTLDKRAFLRQVHEDPTLAYRILEEMSKRIRRLDQELSSFRRRQATGNADLAHSPDQSDRMPVAGV